MVKFIGEYTVKIDDKGRLILPSSFKAILGPNSDLRFVVKKDVFANCLQMYTYEEWAKESESLKLRMNLSGKEHSLLWRELMRDRALVEPDEKLGRISIPKRLLDKIGVSREVIFAGNDHLIEVWAKEQYDLNRMPEEDYAALFEKILG